MGGRCKLCGAPVGGSEGGHCRCGQHLHDDCRADHARTCPSTSADGWVGTQEF